MSYILDALRRSQAERERGHVPGLDAQPALPLPAAPPRRARAAWGLGGALLVAVVLGLWWWLRQSAPPAPPVAEAAPAPVREKPAPLPIVVSAPPAPAAAVAPPVVRAPPAEAPAVVASVAAAASAAAVRSEVRIVRLADLTPEQRQALPPLVVGGTIWSENRLSRFVIINGQVVREGELAAPGVTLESLGPKAALLRWRELRIELPL